MDTKTTNDEMKQKSVSANEDIKKVEVASKDASVKVEDKDAK